MSKSWKFVDAIPTYPMNREAEAHDLPTRPSAAKLWYDDTSYWASSKGKGEYVPITGRLNSTGSIEKVSIGNYICLKFKYISSN